jgi:predicted nuclease of predicted toxin-antitoxin system
MKGFLFDENLPSRLRFSPELPIVSVLSIGRNPSDSQVWEFARERELVIVSKEPISPTGSSRDHHHRG